MHNSSGVSSVFYFTAAKGFFNSIGKKGPLIIPLC